MSWWTDLLDRILGRRPPDPPVLPSLRTLAIIVTQGGKPVVGAACVLRDGDRRVPGITNADGYFAGTLNAVPYCTVELVAVGFNPYVADFVVPTGNYDLLITDRLVPVVPPLPPLPSPPSRDQILAVRMNFQGYTVKGQRIWEPTIPSFPKGDE